MDKINKEKIEKLMKEQKYDEIFVGFGKKAYDEYAPTSHRIKDLNKLEAEGRYDDIYNKYGKNNKLLKKAMFNEIKEERGNIAAYLWSLKQSIYAILKKTGIITSAGLLGLGVLLPTTTTLTKSENSKKYEAEIEQYNDNIEEYAKEVQTMQLSDIQIFMKVMDDLWENIQGYKKPEKDIRGFWELDLATEDGYGVCRNMASDIARKLNEINSEYNARTMVVTMGETGYYEMADIERQILEEDETVQNEADKKENIREEIKENIQGKEEKIKNSIFPNHMVTFVDIPHENLTLVLDPTNPGIGTYINEKIIMLNSEKGDGLQFRTNEIWDAILMKRNR